MTLAVTLEANGWMVALGLVALAGVVYVVRTGRGISSQLVSIEGKSDVAAVTAQVAVETAATAAEHAAVAAAAVGTPNGKGNVTQMIELILSEQGEIRRDAAGLASGHGRIEQRMSTMEERLALIEGRTATIESHITKQTSLDSAAAKGLLERRTG